MSLSQYLIYCDKLDIYQSTVTYLVSRITDSGHILFMIFGIVFGYFYSRNIWYVLNKLPISIPRYLTVVIALFILVCPIWNVSGVRMWTALHVFAYGALPYLLDNDKSKIYWPALSIFIHFSFGMHVALFYCFYLLPHWIKEHKSTISIAYIIFLTSFILNVLDISTISNYLSIILPDYIYENNLAGYMGDAYVETINQLRDSKSMLFNTNEVIGKYGVILLTSFSYIIIRKEENANYRRFFVFALILYSIGNILSIVPSGGRYLVVAKMFLLPSILLSLASIQTAQYRLIRYVCWVFLLPVIFSIRIGCECYGINLFFGNYFWGLLFETNVPIIKYFIL